MGQIVRLVVVVELHDIKLLMQIQVVHAIRRHDIRADGNLYIFL